MWAGEHCEHFSDGEEGEQVERANRRGQGRVRTRARARRNLPGLDAYLTAFIWGWSRQPRLAGRFEGCATPWPRPGWRSASAITLGLRGGIYRPWVRGMGQRGNHRHPASSRRPNRCSSAFWSQWHHSWRLLATQSHPHVHLYDHT